MGLELPINVEHLCAHGVGYDGFRDEITFLPFVHDRWERVDNAKIFAHPITSCGTIEALYLTRSGNVAGIKISRVRRILQENALERHTLQAEDKPLDGFMLLDYAESYANSIAQPGTNLAVRRREIERLRDLLKRVPLAIPPGVQACIDH